MVDMRQQIPIIYIGFLAFAALMLAGCKDGRQAKDGGLAGGGKGVEVQGHDTLYTHKNILNTYGTDPSRALVLIDSALVLGNITPYHADLMRCKVYSQAMDATQQDSAIVIGERLLRMEEVEEKLANRQDVLEILAYSARQLQDFDAELYYNMQLADVCRQQGAEVEALRTDAEIGATMARLGRTDEGLAKIDSVLHLIDHVRKFTELDAAIIAMKRKINLILEVERYDMAIAVGEHLLERLADFERHPDDYHDGFYREPDADTREDYITFYRSQAWAFLADAYAHKDVRKAREYLTLYATTPLGQSLDGRKLIVSALRELKEYDELEEICMKMEAVSKERGDTLTPMFAQMLNDRATAAYAKGRKDESNALWQRHSVVLRKSNERLLRGKAHLYAARFRAHQQQQEIEMEKAKVRQNRRMAIAGALLALLALILAWNAIRQRRIVDQKNRSLVRQIAEAAKLSVALRTQHEASVPPPAEASDGAEAPAVELDALSCDALFEHIRQVIKDEKLYLNPAFDRQAAIGHFHISKERVGAAFAQGSEYAKITDFINLLRLDYARDLMTASPQMSIDEVATASGFAVRRTFSRLFKEKYGLTPTEYRTLYRSEIEGDN